MRFHEAAAAHGLSGYPPGLPTGSRSSPGSTDSSASKSGDYRFYLSGMAQARLLDRLAPGWTARALTEDVSLEELLAEAVGGVK